MFYKSSLNHNMRSSHCPVYTWIYYICLYIMHKPQHYCVGSFCSVMMNNNRDIPHCNIKPTLVYPHSSVIALFDQNNPLPREYEVISAAPWRLVSVWPTHSHFSRCLCARPKPEPPRVSAKWASPVGLKVECFPSESIDEWITALQRALLRLMEIYVTV